MRFTGLLIACGVAGIGGVEGSEAPPEAKPAPAVGGTLRGSITIDGKTESRRHKLGDAVLSLSGEGLAKASPPPPAAPAVIDQKDIAYVPHVLPILAGTTVEFRNSDATLHNVHGHCRKNNGFNLAMTPEQKTTTTFTKAEVVTLTCNVHAEMKAYVVVLDNAFFTQPAAGATYRIAGIPPGTYKLKAWHESMGPVIQEVTIRAGEETAMDVNFDSRKQAAKKE